MPILLFKVIDKICEVKNISFNFPSIDTISLLLTKFQIKYFLKMKKKVSTSTIVVEQIIAISGLIKADIVSCVKITKHDKIKTRHTSNENAYEE